MDLCLAIVKWILRVQILITLFPVKIGNAVVVTENGEGATRLIILKKLSNIRQPLLKRRHVFSKANGHDLLQRLHLGLLLFETGQLFLGGSESLFNIHASPDAVVEIDRFMALSQLREFVRHTLVQFIEACNNLVVQGKQLISVVRFDIIKGRTKAFNQLITPVKKREEEFGFELLYTGSQ
ncbi:hypothetical protein ATO46_01745 [Aeromonas schubertii]|nr:hypothetical protein ATO46_01745 [Aeromonas schubertii]